MPKHLPKSTVHTTPTRRSLILPGILLLVFALASIGATVAIANAKASDSRRLVGSTTARAANEEDQLSSAIGDFRQSNGRGLLRFDEHLHASARAHATQMLRFGFFSHDSPNGDAFDMRIASFGFTGDRRGENIGFEQGYADVSTLTLAQWIASPAHYRILLDRGFSRGAVGVSCSSPEASATCYVVLDVGSST